MGDINVKINGKNVELKDSSTVTEMLQERGITGSMFVIERNLEIIPKENWSSTEVIENDIFEVVGFFGGG